MDVFEAVYSGIQNSLSFLAGGSVCVRCGAKSYAVPLCKACRDRVTQFEPFFSERRCKKCGKILVSERGVCSECRVNTEKSSLDAVFPVHMYRLWMKDLLFTWKTDGQRTLTPFFAEIVYQAFRTIEENSAEGFDGIVPVPVRPGKLKEKGWDQIEDLCTVLSRKYGLKILPVLERCAGVQQKTLNREERKGKLGASYVLKPSAVLSGKRFLILDDIVTTGSTMEKCAAILRENGAEGVSGLLLFMAD